MARLAGEIATAVNFHMNPLSTFDQVVATVREGERRAGRSDSCLIALYARILLSDDLAEARRLGRMTMLGYCGLKSYQELFARAGFEDEMQALAQGLEANDMEAAERAITDELLDDVLVLGPASRCREQLERFRAAGVDVVLFAPPATSAETPIDELFAPVVAEFADYE